MSSEIGTEKERPETSPPPIKPAQIPKLQLQVQKIRNKIKMHTHTSVDSSTIDICIQQQKFELENIVSVYIHPTEVITDSFLRKSKKLERWGFDGLKVEVLKEIFDNIINVDTIDQKTFDGNIYWYCYALKHEDQVYETVQTLHNNYISSE